MKNYTIQNSGAFKKTLLCAGDKSITHRSIMLNALGIGHAIIKSALLSDDCISTINCMRSLGAQIELKNDVIEVKGSGNFKSAKMDCGNSGTTMRLLCGILAAQNGLDFELTGDESLSSRPMKRVIEPLSLMGAKISGNDFRAPLKINGTQLNGISYEMNVASAQVKSAVILAGLYADGETVVKEPLSCRDHTERMLAKMGADIKVNGGAITVKKSKLHAVDVNVAGDISTAAYPMCLAAMQKGSELFIKNVGVNPTRTGILDVFKQMGVDFELLNLNTSQSEPVADIHVKYTYPLKPFKIGAELIPRLVDEIPILAVLACCADGTSIISDAHELRVKESDRISSVVSNLKQFGADIEQRDDGMIIHGGKPLNFAQIDSYNDHRIAMAFAVCARAFNGASLMRPDCVSISYPDFFKEVIL